MLVNKIVDNRIHSVCVTFFSFEHIIVRLFLFGQYDLTSFFFLMTFRGTVYQSYLKPCLHRLRNLFATCSRLISLQLTGDR